MNKTFDATRMQKYEQRGHEDGKALKDWVEAEAEVNQLDTDWRVDQSGRGRP